MSIEAIISQHAEEAAFLWLLRDAAVGAPHYELADLAELDNRVEAHLDGLRAHGEPAWETCKAALGQEQPGEVFAAAVLAFESGDPARVQEVLKVAAASPELARGAISALGWLPYPQAAPHIRPCLTARDAGLRRIGLAAAAVHRRIPDRALAEFLSDPDPLLKARALRAVGELRLLDYHRTVRNHVAADHPAVRFWAAWAGALLLGDKDAVAALQAVGETEGPYQERAVQTASRGLELSAARAWQRKLAQKPTLLRQAVLAAGAIGDPELIPWLLEQMKAPPVARVAGEALSMITGVHLSYDQLEGEAPKGFEAGPTEEPENENVALDPDEDLYWPEPEAVRKWWDARKGEFASGTRRLLGKPISPEVCQQVLRTGYQRQRAAAALELALRQRGTPLFEVRAPGPRQQQVLAAA